MEAQFKDKLGQLHAGEKKSVLIPKDEYFTLIDEVKEAEKVTGTSKTWRQYYILKRYQISSTFVPRDYLLTRTSQRFQILDSVGQYS